MSSHYQKGRGLSLDCPFGKDVAVPDRIQPERCLDLTTKLRAGIITLSEKHELAQGHIRLGLSIAAKYSKRLPRKSRDFVSCAMFGIVYAIHHAQEKMYDNNITPWIAANVNRFCHRFMVTDHITCFPSTTYYEMKKRGEPVKDVLVFLTRQDPMALVGQTTCTIPQPEILPGSAENNSYNIGTSEDETIDKVRVHRPTPFMRQSQQRSRLEGIREDLKLAARDDFDRRIIRMREEGYKDREIAIELQKSLAYINVRRRAIEERFEKLQKRS